MHSCEKCGGAVGEPGKAYGYAGKWCYCERPTPPHPEPVRISPDVLPQSLLEGLAEVRKAAGQSSAEHVKANPLFFLYWLQGYLTAGGADVAVIRAELNRVLS